jgi:hypothetical protein
VPNKKYNKNWGKKQPYKALKDPVLPISFWVATKGDVEWTLKHQESGIVLNNGVLQGSPGVNIFNFSMDVQATSLKKYKEILQTAQKDQKITFDLAKADTGKTYLRKGDYIFVVSKDGKTSEQAVVIE